MNINKLKRYTKAMECAINTIETSAAFINDEKAQEFMDINAILLRTTLEEMREDIQAMSNIETIGKIRKKLHGILEEENENPVE